MTTRPDFTEFSKKLARNKNIKNALERMEGYLFDEWNGQYPPTVCALAILMAIRTFNIFPNNRAYQKKLEKMSDEGKPFPLYSVYDYYRRYGVFNVKNTIPQSAWLTLLVVANDYVSFLFQAVEVSMDSVENYWADIDDGEDDEEEEDEEVEVIEKTDFSDSNDDIPHGFGA